MTQNNKLTEILDKLKSVIDGTNNEFMVRKPYCKILTDKKRVIESIIDYVDENFKSKEKIKDIFNLDDDYIKKIQQKLKTSLEELLKECDKADVVDITEKDILDIYQKLAELKIIFLVNEAKSSNRIIPLFIARKFDEKGALIAESKSGNMIYFGKLDDNSQVLYHIDKNKQEHEKISSSSINDINIILDCYSPPFAPNYDFQSLIRKLNSGTFVEYGVRIDCSNSLCFSLHSLLETLLDSGVNVAVIEYSARDDDKSISQSRIDKFIKLYNFRREEDKHKRLKLKEKNVRKDVKGIRIIKNEEEDFRRTAQFIHIKLSDLERYNNTIEKYEKTLSDGTKDKMYKIFHSITKSITGKDKDGKDKDGKKIKPIENLVYKLFEFYYFLVENINDNKVHNELKNELVNAIKQYESNDKIKKEIKERIINGDKTAIPDEELSNELLHVRLKGLPYINNVNENNLIYKDSYDQYIKKMIIDNGLLMEIGGIVAKKNDIDNLLKDIKIQKDKKEDILNVVKLCETKSGESYYYFNTYSIKYINKLKKHDDKLNNINKYIRDRNIQSQPFTDSNYDLFRKIIFESSKSMANYYEYAISVSDTLINKKGKIKDVNNELIKERGYNYGELIWNIIDDKENDKFDAREDIAVITIFNTLNIQQQRIKDTQFEKLFDLIKKVVKND